MYNLVSTHCLHRCTLSMSFACCPETCIHNLFVISNTPCIPYYPQLSFPHIVYTHAYCPCHLHVVCTCTHHLLVISNTPHIPYYPQLSFCTYCLHTCTLLISSVYCLQMHMLCTSHFYCCYLHMYMSSAYYLSIYILYTHYLQWSLIYSFLTDNADVIHMTSLVLYISYHVQLSFCTLSAQTHIVHVICMLCAHMYTSFVCHLYHSSYILLSTT